ncbi:hypothetical protein C8J56DRAFT_775322, partial [Mycena floridula]
MLCKDLKDSDIPHRTVLRQCLMEIWNEYLDELAQEMGVSLGKISFTMDLWTDPNLVPFMAITAHWIET